MSRKGYGNDSKVQNEVRISNFSSYRRVLFWLKFLKTYNIALAKHKKNDH